MHITHRIRFELLLDLHEPLKVFKTFNEYLRVLIVDLERPNWLVYAVRGRDQNWTVVSLQSQSVSCSHHRRISESTKTKQQTSKWLSFNNVNTKLPSPALHKNSCKMFYRLPLQTGPSKARHPCHHHKCLSLQQLGYFVYASFEVPSKRFPFPGYNNFHIVTVVGGNSTALAHTLTPRSFSGDMTHHAMTPSPLF